MQKETQNDHIAETSLLNTAIQKYKSQNLSLQKQSQSVQAQHQSCLHDLNQANNQISDLSIQISTISNEKDQIQNEFTLNQQKYQLKQKSFEDLSQTSSLLTLQNEDLKKKLTVLKEECESATKTSVACENEKANLGVVLERNLGVLRTIVKGIAAETQTHVQGRQINEELAVDLISAVQNRCKMVERETCSQNVSFVFDVSLYL